ALDWRAFLTDIVGRPFVVIGAFAYGLMVPMAWTSTRAAIKRLGKRWNEIHQRIYIVGVLAVVHFTMAVKADTTGPAGFGIAIGALLLYRWVNRKPRPGLLKDAGT